MTLGNSVEHYPKCLECKGNPDILSRRRKIVTEKGSFIAKTVGHQIVAESKTVYYLRFGVFYFLVYFMKIVFSLNILFPHLYSIFA